MVHPVGWEKMNPVQIALFNAGYQLSALHGLVMEHLPYDVDFNLEVIKLVHEAEEWLKTHDCKDNYHESSD